MSFKKWTFAPVDKSAAADLMSACEIDGFLAALLHARGVTTPEEANALLLGHEDFEDPYSFADMDAAVERVQRAIDTGEKIAVFGDYDADGVTATVLMVTYLREKGADVFYRIPLREEEGYGLHRSTIEELVEQGARLLITVDNGISSIEEVALANRLGMDVVVTDHHQPQEELPPAVAVVNPHRPDCESAFKHYAGVGVAFKLLCALEGDDEWVLDRYADLVAIGTLADVMPLVGENRRLVRAGIRMINAGARPGIAALAKAAGAAGRPQTASFVVFTIAPRINAAGRMGDPDCAVRLLLAEEPEATELAEQIQQFNVSRQQKESGILAEVMAHIDAHPETMAQRVLVLAGEGWYPGVVGIIAARVMDKYGKPCILLSVNDGVAKGSGRSIEGFSLFDAIASCSDMLLNFGGHQLAAGLGIPADRIDEFRERINAYAASMPDMPVPELRLDFRLPPTQISVDKLEKLQLLEPYGVGNPSPLFALMRMQVTNITGVAGKHTRLSLMRDGAQVAAIRFGTPPQTIGLQCGDVIDLAVTLDRSEYRGVTTVSVNVRDWRFTDTDQDEEIAAARLFDQVMRGESMPNNQRASLAVTRDQAAILYRFLKAAPYTGTWERLHHHLSQSLTAARLRTAAEVLREAGLIEVHDA
ncbi:MAG: single-stranded-DNA-specific exonuclease RecJ, partial [Clostridia bacterium]|nr:single-stranded-DNA-specific exonuclease RecJ [Clostridia bacterium]